MLLLRNPPLLVVTLLNHLPVNLSRARERLLHEYLCVCLSSIKHLDYLYVALGLLVEKHVVLPTGKELTSEEAHLDDTRKARQLPASVTLLFNISLHSQKQLRQFKYTIVSLVNNIVSGLSYTDIQRDMEEGGDKREQLLLSIFQEALYYTVSLSQSQTHSNDEASNRFWQAMLKKTCDTIDGVSSLLSLDSFLTIVHQLLIETEGDVLNKSLNMLNTKLESLNTNQLTSQHVHDTLLEVVDVVVGVALTETVAMTTRQNALYSLKLLIQRLASQHSDKFINVTSRLLNTMEEQSLLVCSNGLLCIAELCIALVARVIPLLPRILACLMAYCTGHVTNGKDQLPITALSSLCVVVQTLPQFLSSTLYNLIVKSCDLINNEGCTELTQQASKLRQLLANRIPARVLLPAIVKCYNALWDGSKCSVVALVGMLSVSIERLTREEVRSHTQTLVDTFLVMLDYRTMKQGQVDQLTSILEVERNVINAFACLVVKLSEASFRPIFLKLLDWSSRSDSHHKRPITFYHLTNIIAERLKSLFILFASHQLVQNAAHLLDACNDSKQDELYFADQTDHSDDERTTLLLHYVLDTLHKCLLYDKGGSFLTKSNFTTLLKPLVDQVSNHHGVGSTCYHDRLTDLLVPCISQLAVAATTGKDTLWKELNSQLLVTATRQSKPEVKIAVLKIVREIYSKLGEEFAVLLPETIPYLAELMEDESLDVEKQAHSVIVLIEEIVGESVQQYF